MRNIFVFERFVNYSDSWLKNLILAFLHFLCGIMELLRLLRKLEESDLPDDLDRTLLAEEYAFVRDIENLADKTLIDINGKSCFDVISTLKENGFHVFPGEVDSFGWLSGCIQTKKGVIVYG